MKNSLQLLVANPAAKIFRQGARLAVGHGLDRDGELAIRKVLGQPQPGTEFGKIVTKQEEGTIIFADPAAAGGQRIEAWRGATSNYEVYIADGEPARTVIVGDHYGDVLALVPPARRVLDPRAVADHLLFGTVPGTGTYVGSIGRLGHGEAYRWDGARTERQLFDPMISRPRPDQPSLDAIEAALDRTIGQLSVAEDCVNQLSGGVDSSLLQTFLPASTPTVSGGVDSPEFARERGYAEQASRLLGTRHEMIINREEEFPTMLIEATRRLRQPVRMPQSVAFRRVFQAPAARFITGLFADALFGLKPSLGYATAYGQRHLLRLASGLGAARLLPATKANGLRHRIERVQQVEVPINDWRGLGARVALSTNPVLVERIVGTAMMRQRIEASAAYVAARFNSEERDTDPLFAHLEFGHMMDFYCTDSISRWRQLAYADGKSVLAPFAGRSIVAAALAVPRRRRYIAEGRVKYLLKQLLSRRLPSFAVDALKAGGDLPFQRYLTAGPLKDAFDHYTMPDGVDRATAAKLRGAPDILTWNLLTLAVWRDEVLADSALAPAQATRVLQVG